MKKQFNFGILWLIIVGMLHGFATDGLGDSTAKDTTDQAKRPNILVILADDLGYSDIGCYGSEIKTPNLDALAKDGVRFSQFYNTGRCWPTRSSLLTGYYAQQIGRDKIPGLKNGGARGQRPQWAPLLPERLKPQGYRCYHSGKWHIDGAVLRGGFDKSYRLNDHDRFFSPKNHLKDDQKMAAIPRGKGHYSTTFIADHAIECLKDHASQHADKPFFQYVAFIAPHFPLHAPQEDIDRYRDTYIEGWEKIRAKRYKRIQELGLIGKSELSEVEREIGPPYHRPKDLEILGPSEVNRPVPWDSLSPEQKKFQATKMAIHAAMIDRMDQEIGRILKQVESMGQTENTLVVFLSDNGASAEIMVRGDGHKREAAMGSADSYLCLGPGWSNTSNTPFRRHKTWVHEGGIATPMIVRWPQGIKSKDQIRHAPGHVVDLAPTFLELAQLNASPVSNGSKFPGQSLLSSFESDTTTDRNAIWWAHEGHRAIRLGDWKLVASRGEEWELFDLGRDRAETSDLSSQYPERVKQLANLWKKHANEFAEKLAEERPGKKSKNKPGKESKNKPGKKSKNKS